MTFFFRDHSFSTPAGIYLLKVKLKDANGVVLLSFLLALNIFHTLF